MLKFRAVQREETELLRVFKSLLSAGLKFMKFWKFLKTEIAGLAHSVVAWLINREDNPVADDFPQKSIQQQGHTCRV